MKLMCMRLLFLLMIISIVMASQIHIAVYTDPEAGPGAEQQLFMTKYLGQI